MSVHVVESLGFDTLCVRGHGAVQLGGPLGSWLWDEVPRQRRPTQGVTLDREYLKTGAGGGTKGGHIDRKQNHGLRTTKDRTLVPSIHRSGVGGVG